MRPAVTLWASVVLAVAAVGPARALGPPHDASRGIACVDCHGAHLLDDDAPIASTTSAPGTTTTLVDGAQTWLRHEWVGSTLRFVAGANAGLDRLVTANTPTTLSWVPPLPAPVAAGDTYHIERSRERLLQEGCETCHNPVGMAAGVADIGFHVTSGGVIVTCGACHDPHNGETSAGQGLSLIRSDVPWPTARQPTVYPAPDNPLVAGEAAFNGLCETCHTQTAHHRNDAVGDHEHYRERGCTVCHRHADGFIGYDHQAAGAVRPVPGCMSCHGLQGPDVIADVHDGQCELCHADPDGAGPLVAPLEDTAPSGGTCHICHSGTSGGHQGVGHVASPASGPVLIFDDADHDDAGHVGARPYFDVEVVCSGCHVTELRAAHGDACGTCHPSPRDTLGTWGGGCQEGGCHAEYHADSTTAHLDFEWSSDPTVDCRWCHSASWSVPQSSCANCHKTLTGPDTTPPVTTSDAQASYVGAARIRFSITDSGKVGIGTTFYRLDGASAVTGPGVLVFDSGPHTLEFWSVDQRGNLEATHHTASFTVSPDTTPPTTTSNAQAAYYQFGTITLTATDASSEGVRTTWYRLDGAAPQAGRVLTVPVVSGTVSHTLAFWSEDWSGNVETPKTVSFTVTGGTCTIRLVWGDSDVSGPPTHPEAAARWTIRRGGPSGYIAAAGEGANPGWSGVADEVVPVRPEPHYVAVEWWDWVWGYWEFTDFQNVDASVPGSVVRLSY